MDKIFIRDLALRCIVGTLPHERTVTQEVILNITLETDLRAAGKSDDLYDTVNYLAVQENVLEMVEKSEYLLIESIAERAAEICLAENGVVRATVSVDKPAALRFCRSVAVEISRP